MPGRCVPAAVPMATHTHERRQTNGAADPPSSSPAHFSFRPSDARCTRQERSSPSSSPGELVVSQKRASSVCAPGLRDTRHIAKPGTHTPRRRKTSLAKEDRSLPGDVLAAIHLHGTALFSAVHLYRAGMLNRVSAKPSFSRSAVPRRTGEAGEREGSTAADSLFLCQRKQGTGDGTAAKKDEFPSVFRKMLRFARARIFGDGSLGSKERGWGRVFFFRNEAQKGRRATLRAIEKNRTICRGSECKSD